MYLIFGLMILTGLWATLEYRNIGITIFNIVLVGAVDILFFLTVTQQVILSVEMLT